MPRKKSPPTDPPACPRCAEWERRYKELDEYVQLVEQAWEKTRNKFGESSQKQRNSELEKLRRRKPRLFADRDAEIVRLYFDQGLTAGPIFDAIKVDWPTGEGEKPLKKKAVENVIQREKDRRSLLSP